MDTKEYIASGILESYAMGLSSEQESKEVECLMSIYPEVKMELQNIQLSLEKYANSIAVSPPEVTKQKILSVIKKTEQDLNTGESVDQKKENSPTERQDQSGKLIKMKPYFRFAVASIVLLLIGFAYVFNQMQADYNSLREDLVAYKKETNQYITAITDSLDRNLEERSFLLDKATQTIMLAGTELSPDSKVRIFWNTQKNEYVLNYDQLPKAKDGTQYQLWAIADGKPVDMGVLNKSTQTTEKRAIAIENIQAFAITLEKEGGSKVPTLEAMYVVGNV